VNVPMRTLLDATPEEAKQFWDENEEEIKKIVDPVILYKIEEFMKTFTQ
jgi:hypothetical protein